MARDTRSRSNAMPRRPPHPDAPSLVPALDLYNANQGLMPGASTDVSLVHAINMLTRRVEELSTNRPIKGLQAINRKAVVGFFDQLPKELRAGLIKIERSLEDRMGKLVRAEENVRRAELAVAGRGPRHKLAENLLHREWQVSKEEMADTAEYNIKVAFEELCKRQAQDFQMFTLTAARHSMNVYKKLVHFNSFVSEASVVTNEYLGRTDAFDQIDRQHICDVVAIWCKSSHQRVVADVNAKQARKTKKREKYETELAQSNARLDGLGTDAVVLTGLLEAAGLLQQDTGVESQNAVVAGKRPKTKKVTSCSTLGVLCAKHPEVAKKYNIEVVQKSLGGKKDEKRNPKPKKPAQRSRSNSARSHSTSRSVTPKRSRSRSASKSSRSRSTSRSKSKSRSRSTSRTSFKSNDSFRSARSSRSSSSRRSTGKGKGKGKNKKRDRRPVFRKTPFPSPRV